MSIHVNEKKRKLIDENGVCRINVGGKYAEKYGNYTTCSPIDFATLSKFNWTWSPLGYPSSSIQEMGKVRGILMSRFIMGEPNGMMVDHIDNNPQNNTRENLRLVTAQQNAQNRKKSKKSKVKYFGIKVAGKKYGAGLTISGTPISLGTFDTAREAAIVYDIFITQNQEKEGWCFSLNFPEKRAEYLQMDLITPKEQTNVTGYRGVHKISENSFRVMIHLPNQPRCIMGPFKTALQAAKAYDSTIVKYKLTRKLNFPDDYPNFQGDKPIKTFPLEIMTSNSLIIPALRSIGLEFDQVDTARDILLPICGKKGKGFYTIIERVDYDLIKFNRLHFGDGKYIQVGNKRLSRHYGGPKSFNYRRPHLQ